ncbi:MAG: alanine--tRNA ligase-related protein [bacterium]|nr:alanine--tRNA ligase-related protein [bacterium]
MNSREIRQKFLEFFKEKGHAIVPSSSLLPDDPSVLLTTAGMQQFKRYYTGELDAERDFGARRTASIQKCFRTSDIEEVGDETHLTFFEMLGNFSFGDYFKEESIVWAYEFMTERLGVSPERIRVSIFNGNERVPRDFESYRIWHEAVKIPKERIDERGMEDNFWGPTGTGGPCGPTTEIYVDGVEIWNLVFNEFSSDVGRDELLSGGGTLSSLTLSGVDTGLGFERLLAILGGHASIFETDLLHPLVTDLASIAPGLEPRVLRVLADHLRSSIMLIGDGVTPSNKEAGYILRRLLRRILAYQITHDIHADLFPYAIKSVQGTFGDIYKEVNDTERILGVLQAEKQKFEKAIAKGLGELQKYQGVGAKEAFMLYETYGLPFELIKELAPTATVKDLTREEFDREFERHKEISRAGALKKFGGHGLILNTGELKAADHEELNKVTRLHTATHLMQQALRDVLGPEVQQRGSDITAERTRFDFAFPRKLTPEELKKVEEIINEKVDADLPVQFVELTKTEAIETGALYFFREKYPERVKIYFVGSTLQTAYSKEFCGGPHVTHTGEIGKCAILKEEAVGAGVRRIRATVE